MTEVTINLADNRTAQLLYGDLNRNLGVIEKDLGVDIAVRGTAINLKGPELDVNLAQSALQQLYDLSSSGYPIYPPDVAYALQILSKSPRTILKDIFLDKVYITASQGVVSPKSINQKKYIDLIRKDDIVFGIGPAGTGKTYLAVAMAVAALTSNQVKRLILARPAVEAGERLGFLPGDMAQKIDPYLRPLYDALYEMLGRERTIDLIEQGIIEIAPLAFMRGRTLSSAFVILDEAQNTTREQMKMFLTRLGFNSQAVITGDITQIDLPDQRGSGLLHATRILKGINGISFSNFSGADIVRHPLVQNIIMAYEKRGDRKKAED